MTHADLGTEPCAAPSPAVATGFGLLTAADVAAVLQVPESWVCAQARAGHIPHVALGRYRRFRPDAIEAWVAQRQRQPRLLARYVPRLSRARPVAATYGQPVGNLGRFAGSQSIAP